jgi:hypothetical protein
MRSRKAGAVEDKELSAASSPATDKLPAIKPELLLKVAGKSASGLFCRNS